MTRSVNCCESLSTYAGAARPKWVVASGTPSAEGHSKQRNWLVFMFGLFRGGEATWLEAQWTWRSHVASPPGCSCQRDDAPFYTTESTCIRASDRHRACADSKTVNTCKIKHLQNICKNFLVFYFTPNRGLIFTVHLGAWLNEGNASFAHSRCRRKPWQRIELIIAEKTAEVSK